MLHRVQVVVTRIVWGLVSVIDRRTGDWVSHKGDVGNGASACVLVRFLICRLRREAAHAATTIAPTCFRHVKAVCNRQTRAANCNHICGECRIHGADDPESPAGRFDRLAALIHDRQELTGWTILLENCRPVRRERELLVECIHVFDDVRVVVCINDGDRLPGTIGLRRSKSDRIDSVR